MATVEQQAAEIFREELQELWDRRRNQEIEILDSLDEALSKVDAYLEAVRTAAADITKSTVYLQRDDPKFDLNKRSIEQTYRFSGPADYRIDLTYDARDVFYNGVPYPPHELSRLFQRLGADLVNVFKPK